MCFVLRVFDVHLLCFVVAGKHSDCVVKVYDSPRIVRNCYGRKHVACL
jgi:hypothetical protein